MPIDAADVITVKPPKMGLYEQLYLPAIFEGLKTRAKARGLDLETRILVGHAADQILRLARDTQSDLIVVGHRGHSVVREWLFGTTSQRIVSHASVLIRYVTKKGATMKSSRRFFQRPPRNAIQYATG